MKSTENIENKEEEKISKAELYETIKCLKEFMYKIELMDDFPQIDIAVSEIKALIYSKKYLADEFELRCKKWEDFTKTNDAKNILLHLYKNIKPTLSKRNMRYYISEYNIFGVFRYFIEHVSNIPKDKYIKVKERLKWYFFAPCAFSFLCLNAPISPISGRIIMKYIKDLENFDFYILMNESVNSSSEACKNCNVVFLYQNSISQVCYRLIECLDSLLSINTVKNDMSYFYQRFFFLKDKYYPELAILTPAEIKVFKFLCQRKTNEEIAKELRYPKKNNGKYKTIENHASNIYSKLEVSGKKELSEKYKYIMEFIN